MQKYYKSGDIIHPRTIIFNFFLNRFPAPYLKRVVTPSEMLTMKLPGYSSLMATLFFRAWSGEVLTPMMYL